MRLDVRPRHCILCHAKSPDSWEHVIPEYLGGRLQVPLLCTPCNSTIGSKLVGQLKRDPGIRIAAERLAPKMPRLYEAMRRGWTYVAKGPEDQTVRVKAGKSRDRIVARRTPKGSLLIDTKEARRKIEEMLVSEAVPLAEIKKHLQRLESAKNLQVIEFPSGISTVLQPIESLQPDLAHPLADERLFALVALEYLFLVIGNQVLVPYFGPVVAYILNGDRPEYLGVEHLKSGQYSASHRIYVVPTPRQIQVYIWIFGYHVYRVTFGRLGNTLRQAPVYLEDLEARQSLWAASLEEARRGNFMSLRA